MKTCVLGIVLLMILPAPALGSYASEVLKDGPSAYWRLADPDRTTIVDAAEGHHGRVEGGQGSIAFRQPSLVPSDSDGFSVTFDGRDRIVVPGFDKISEDGYTVEYWIQVERFPDGFMNVVGDGTGGGTFFLMNYLHAGGRVRAHFGYANTPLAIDSTAPLAPGLVYHVVATFDPVRGTGNIYLNGKLNRSVSVTKNQDPVNESNVVFIGRDDREDRTARFKLDEVALYDYALTADRIAAHWSAAGAEDLHGDGVARRRESALERLNLYRALGGLPPVRLNSDGSKDAAAHARYLVLNGLIEHAEDPRLPGYTPEGNAAGLGSNISPGLGIDAIDILYAVPYHRLLMVHPMLSEVGIGDDINLDTGFTALVLYFYRFDGSFPAKDSVVLSPAPFSQGNGLAPLTGERPAPLPDFGPSYGFPIMAQFFTTYGTPLHFDSRISVKGRDLPHQVISANRPSNPSFEQRLVALIPDDPLPKSADVSVSLSYLLYNEPKRLSWHFSTGEFERFDALAAGAGLADPRRNLGALENPTDGGHQSGIGIISGWKCDAKQIVIEIDGVHRVPVAYGSSRNDTQSACGDANNGFSVLVNWANLGDGPHSVRVLADGKQFGDAKVNVHSFGSPFVRDATRSMVLDGFPAAGESTPLHWSEAAQNFRLGSGSGTAGSQASDASAASDLGFLESPTANGFASGIATIHGWTCSPSPVRIFIDGKELGVAPGGMPRADTREICGNDRTGFAYLYNWALLPPGVHTVAAYAGDQLIGENRVTVARPGKVTTPFLRGVKARYAVENFPSVGRSAVIEWMESQQNFVIVGVFDGSGAPKLYPEPGDGRLLATTAANGEPMRFHAQRTDEGRITALDSVVVGASELGVPSDMLTYDPSGRPARFFARDGVSLAFTYAGSGVEVKELKAGSSSSAARSGAPLLAETWVDQADLLAQSVPVLSSDVTFIDTCPRGASTPVADLGVRVAYRPVNAFCGSLDVPAASAGGGNYTYAIPVAPGRGEIEVAGLKRAACDSTKEVLEFACAGGEPVSGLRQELRDRCPSLGDQRAVRACQIAVGIWEATCQLDELCSKAIPVIESLVGTCAGSGSHLDAIGRFPKYGAVGDTLWLPNGVDSAPPRHSWKIRTCKGAIPCAADERICAARDQRRCARWECDRSGQFGDADGCMLRTVQCPPGKACHEPESQAGAIADSVPQHAADIPERDLLHTLVIVSDSTGHGSLASPQASGSSELCE